MHVLHMFGQEIMRLPAKGPTWQSCATNAEQKILSVQGAFVLLIVVVVVIVVVEVVVVVVVVVEVVEMVVVGVAVVDTQSPHKRGHALRNVLLTSSGTLHTIAFSAVQIAGFSTNPKQFFSVVVVVVVVVDVVVVVGVVDVVGVADVVDVVVMVVVVMVVVVAVVVVVMVVGVVVVVVVVVVLAVNGAVVSSGTYGTTTVTIDFTAAWQLNVQPPTAYEGANWSVQKYLPELVRLDWMAWQLPC